MSEVKFFTDLKEEIVPKASKIARQVDNNYAKQDVKYTAKAAVPRRGRWHMKKEKIV